MTPRPPDPPDDDDDAELFRQAIGQVRRLDPGDPPPPRPRPSPRPRQREADELAMRELLRNDPFALGRPVDDEGYRRDNVPARVLRRLRSGQFAVEDEIDLHGMDMATAAEAIARFLAEARAGGLRCVRIIHGKGLHRADGTPVLRSLTDALLRRRAEVLAFGYGPASGGGSGAVLVLLAATPR